MKKLKNYEFNKILKLSKEYLGCPLKFQVKYNGELSSEFYAILTEIGDYWFYLKYLIYTKREFKEIEKPQIERHPNGKDAEWAFAYMRDQVNVKITTLSEKEYKKFKANVLKLTFLE